MVDQPSPFAGYTPFSEDPKGLGAAQKPAPIGQPSGGVVPPPAAAATSPFGGYAPNQDTATGELPGAPPKSRTEGIKVASDYNQLPWGEAAVMAAQNLPTSVVHNIKDLYETGKYAVQNPEEFGSAIHKGAGDFYRGFVAKGKGRSEEEMDPDARAALEAAKKSATEISTEPGLKKFLVERPADVMGFASPIMTGTGSALSKVPVLGMPTAGKILTTAGELSDPILGPVKAAKLASDTATKGSSVLFSLKSGASYDSLKNAAESGAVANPKFLSHLFGNGDINEITDGIVNSIRKEQALGHEEYKRGRAGLSQQTDLPFDKVEAALQNQYPRVMNKNGVINDRAGYDALQNLRDKIAEYKAQPAGSNGIDDFDRLKRYIDDLKRDHAQNPGIAGMLGDVRKSVYGTMYDADPKYAKVMSKYQDMLDDVKEIKNGFLSGNVNSPNAVATIKKVINSRDKGYMKSTWDKLIEHNPDIPHMVAAQELRNTMPMGLRGMISNFMSAGMDPLTAVLHTLVSSPNVAGVAQYGAGLTTGALPTAALKAGREIPYPLRMGAQLTAEQNADQARETNRVGRASGGSVLSANKADQLIKAAESAKKAINSRTEVLLDQPDEKIAGALAIAKRHI